MKRLLGAVAGLLILGGTLAYADSRVIPLIATGTVAAPVPQPEAYVFFGLGALGLVAAYLNPLERQIALQLRNSGAFLE